MNVDDLPLCEMAWQCLSMLKTVVVLGQQAFWAMCTVLLVQQVAERSQENVFGYLVFCEVQTMCGVG